MLLAALLAPIPIALVPSALRPEALAVVIVALLAWMLRGATLRLHGAEHRAIAAADTRSLVDTWHGRARPSRFSLRCGTRRRESLRWTRPGSRCEPWQWYSQRTGSDDLHHGVQALPGGNT